MARGTSPFKGYSDKEIGTVNVLQQETPEGVVDFSTYTGKPTTPIEQTQIDSSIDIDGETISVGDTVYLLGNWTGSTEIEHYNEMVEQNAENESFDPESGEKIQKSRKESDQDFIEKGVIQYFTLEEDPEFKDLEKSFIDDEFNKKHLFEELQNDDIYIDLNRPEDKEYFKNLLQERAKEFVETALEDFPKEVPWAVVNIIDPTTNEVQQGTSKKVVHYNLKKATSGEVFGKEQYWLKVAKVAEYRKQKKAAIQQAWVKFSQEKYELKAKFAEINDLVKQQAQDAYDENSKVQVQPAIDVVVGEPGSKEPKSFESWVQESIDTESKFSSENYYLKRLANDLYLSNDNPSADPISLEAGKELKPALKNVGDIITYNREEPFLLAKKEEEIQRIMRINQCSREEAEKIYNVYY